MSSHINDSKNRKHEHELPSKQNLHANNRNTKLLVIMALSTKYSNVISFAFAKRDMFMISKQNLHQSIKKLLNLANQILKVLFIRVLINFILNQKKFSVNKFKNSYDKQYLLTTFSVNKFVAGNFM